MSWEAGDSFEMEGEQDIQELYRDLGRKYRNVGKKVEDIWRNFTPKQREKAMRESTGDGVVLKHSRDRSLGNLYEYIPEYNLQDMKSNPDHFLNIFKFRATEELMLQIVKGAKSMPGDRELMEKTTDLRYAHAPDNEYTFFLAGGSYGQSFRVNPGKTFTGFKTPGANDLLVSGAVGVRILSRQQTLFQFLNHIVEEILDLGSQTRTTATHEKSTNEALVTATSNLSIKPKPLKSSLPEVRAHAMESKAALEDYLLLLRAEPIVLNQAVNTAFWSRAELVPDDRGRILPAVTDRYLTAALFDSVTTAVKAIAIWDYILCLLQLLENTSDKVEKGLILQELSNTCYLEYHRTQESFKRKVAPHMANKRFKRMTDSASGQSKIVMKGQPADCTVSDPQLHYILRLCHPDTSPSAAVQWIQKLDDHHKLHSGDRKRLAELEMAALGDLSIIVSFMHITSTAVSMAPHSRKSRLLFTARAAELKTELEKLKPKADFGDYLIPMDNLLEPDMAASALAALDDFIVQETGARLGSLYEDTVQDSLKDLMTMYADAKARLEKADEKTTYVPLPTEEKPSDDARLAQRRAKEKTRPAESSVYTITAAPETPRIVVTEPAPQFKVKASTQSTFTALLDKSKARGSVSWTAFESAMADLGFSVTPKGGSIFTFNPPDAMNTRPITLHRPHISDIEGHVLLIIASRLERKYGWNAESFVVA